MQQAHHKRLPNLFVVGAQKAGTTSLFDWLAQHPDICGTRENKETPFFADDALFEKGIDSYARIFPDLVEQTYLMAGSVHYVFFPEALPRLRDFCPDARILVMVRNPIDRAISAYRYALQRGLEDRTFDQAITEELAAADWEQAYTNKIDRFQKYYVGRSLYGLQLSRLYAVVPAEHVFVGMFEQMVSQPEAFMKSLYDFLGLDYFPIENNVRNSTQGMPRNPSINRIYFREGFRNSHPMKLLKKILPHSLRVRARRSVLKLITNPARRPDCDVSVEIRHQLQQVFRQDLQQLDNATAQDWIAGWGLESGLQPEARIS